MELTLLGHACVRLDKDGSRLVIDPGVFSADDALEGADAVLITHEHVDHVVPDALRAALAGRPDLEVWAPQGLVATIAGDDDAVAARVHAATPGEHVDAAGFGIDVVGGKHALIHPDVPQAANVGYVVDGSVLHPGDSFTLPETEVDVVLVPVAGPWMKVAEAIDYVRSASARRAIPIHDAIYTDGGKGLVDRLLGPQGPGTGGTAYARVQPGETVTVG
jgi:L-ascorbate metabolism protein UlaG (beta-lactamase superfamily)